MRRFVLVFIFAAILAFGRWPSAEAQPSTPDFGDGSDGPITFSADTQFNPPVDAIVNSGSLGATTLTVSSPSGVFQPGQKILIHQTRGAGAGQWEMNQVQSYALGNLGTVRPLANAYATSGANAAQVLVVPEYTNVTVNAGVTLSAKPWNGSTGGILAFFANGTIAVAGTVSAAGSKGSTFSGAGTAAGGTGGGFRGGQSISGGFNQAYSGEGTGVASAPQTAANGNGGGGALASSPGAPTSIATGGGGGNGAAGGNGPIHQGKGTGGTGGSAAGSADLTTMVLGGGGEPAVLGRTLQTFLNAFQTWAGAHIHTDVHGTFTLAPTVPPTTVPDITAKKVEVK